MGWIDAFSYTYWVMVLLYGGIFKHDVIFCTLRSVWTKGISICGFQIRVAAV